VPESSCELLRTTQHQEYMMDPEKFQHKARDWTDFYSLSKWYPKLHHLCPHELKGQIKVLLMANKASIASLPKEVIICLAIPDLVPLGYVVFLRWINIFGNALPPNQSGINCNKPGGRQREKFDWQEPRWLGRENQI